VNDSFLFVILLEGLPSEVALLAIGEKKVNDLVALVVEDTSKLHNFHIDAGRVVYEAFKGSSIIQKLHKFTLFGAKSCVINIYGTVYCGRCVIGAGEGLRGVFIPDGVVRI
jgi:hypothetical protein